MLTRGSDDILELIGIASSKWKLYAKIKLDDGDRTERMMMNPHQHLALTFLEPVPQPCHALHMLLLLDGVIKVTSYECWSYGKASNR